jgi:hypothetical protein
MKDLDANDPSTWMDTLWQALECYREDCISGSDYDEEWDEICTAMAWIGEKIGVKNETI